MLRLISIILIFTFTLNQFTFAFQIIPPKLAFSYAVVSLDSEGMYKKRHHAPEPSGDSDQRESRRDGGIAGTTHEENVNNLSPFNLMINGQVVQLKFIKIWACFSMKNYMPYMFYMVKKNYNDRGLLTLINYSGGLLDYTYEEATGKLTSVSTGTGENLSYTYDGSLLLSTTWSGTFNHTLSRSYDNFFRVTSQTLGGTAIDFQYDDDSLLVTAGTLSLTRSPQNGLITSTYLEGIDEGLEDVREYNSFGEIASYIAQYGANTVASFNYTRDPLGRITQKVETVSGVTNTFDYVYDLTGRLTDVSKNGANISHYEFDSNGNRTLASTSVIPAQAGTFPATYDSQDRLLTYGDFSYTYSANGELQTKTHTITGEVTSYNYDVLGNLLSIILPDGTLIEYLIDGQNRRIGKKVNGVLTKGWLYQDSLNPVAELDSSGNIVSRFVYGSWPYCPDYMIKGGETYRIVQDHLGSPRVIVNVNTGTIAQQLDFDEYGNMLTDTNTAFQPFAFAGGLYDPDTGLIRFGARDYDSLTGRWTAKDPTDFNGGDTNLYRYCFADPVNYFDVEGEFAAVVTQFALAITLAVIGTFALQNAINSDQGQKAIGDMLRGASDVFSSGPCPPDDDDPEKKRKSINQINEEIKRGQAPRSVERADKGKIKGEQDHIHFKDGTAINRDGSFKHNPRPLTGIEKSFLKRSGFNVL